jgi:hypothetical protein
VKAPVGSVPVVEMLRFLELLAQRIREHELVVDVMAAVERVGKPPWEIGDGAFGQVGLSRKDDFPVLTDRLLFTKRIILQHVPE